jgi:hypothetical protein
MRDAMNLIACTNWHNSEHVGDRDKETFKFFSQWDDMYTIPFIFNCKIRQRGRGA